MFPFKSENHRFQLLFTRLLLMYCKANRSGGSQLTEGRQEKELSGHESLQFCQHSFIFLSVSGTRIAPLIWINVEANSFTQLWQENTHFSGT